MRRILVLSTANRRDTRLTFRIAVSRVSRVSWSGSCDVPMSRCPGAGAIWQKGSRAFSFSFTQTFRPDGTLYHFILSKRRHLSKLSEMRKSFYMRLLESIILHVVGQHVEAA